MFPYPLNNRLVILKNNDLLVFANGKGCYVGIAERNNSIAFYKAVEMENINQMIMVNSNKNILCKPYPQRD
jgi:hypothetical protein